MHAIFKQLFKIDACCKNISVPLLKTTSQSTQIQHQQHIYELQTISRLIPEHHPWRVSFLVCLCVKV